MHSSLDDLVCLCSAQPCFGAVLERFANSLREGCHSQWIVPCCNGLRTQPEMAVVLQVSNACPATPKQSHNFPVSFDDDKLEEATIEVMDMSVGDLVSVGGPDACPWDGLAQQSMPALLSTDLNFGPSNRSMRSSAQHAQAGTAEQAVQTEAASAEQSVHSTQRAAAPGSNRSIHSRGSQVEAASEHLLPLNCRVAARVSTKLPPLDHEPKLPPLPENFVLPPEMHPVLGKYTWHETHATQTSPTASDKAAKEQTSAAGMDLLTGELPQGTQGRENAVPGSHAAAAQADREAAQATGQDSSGGKWLHHKGAPPSPVAG